MKLPRSVTKVTPLSKLLAIFLFVLLPFIGFYFGMMYKASLTGSPEQTKIACVKDSDCLASMKCENGTCVDVGCLDEGQMALGYSVINSHHATKCCEGLVEIKWSQYYDQNCKSHTLDGGPGPVCAKCGNGTCESEWETSCNCPSDCK